MSGSTLPPPTAPLVLDITIVSAENLKNVNWLNGDLSPYVVAYLEPNHKVSTKPSSGSTEPVWNERFLLSLPTSPPPYLLTLEIFHTDTTVVGSVLIPITLPDIQIPAYNKFEVLRPSCRPHGTIELKLALIPRPPPPPPPRGQDYQFAQTFSYNPDPATPPTYYQPQQSYFPSVLYALIPVSAPPQQPWHAPIPGSYLPPQQSYHSPSGGFASIPGSQPPHQTPLLFASDPIPPPPPHQSYPTPPPPPPQQFDPLHECYPNYYLPNPTLNPALDPQESNGGIN